MRLDHSFYYADGSATAKVHITTYSVITVFLPSVTLTAGKPRAKPSAAPQIAASGTVSNSPLCEPARSPQGAVLLTVSQIFGGHSEGVTPVPIPNTEVKPLSADGTARATWWESRSPPNYFGKAPVIARSITGAFFCACAINPPDNMCRAIVSDHGAPPKAAIGPAHILMCVPPSRHAATCGKP